MIHFKKNIAISFILVLFAFLLLLSGCGAGKTTVVALQDTHVKFTRAEIFEEKSTVQVPEDMKAQFETVAKDLILDISFVG